jgi:hypothetical protein
VAQAISSALDQPGSKSVEREVFTASTNADH